MSEDYERYKKTQIDALSFEEEFEKYSKGQKMCLDIFLRPFLKTESVILDAGCGDGVGLKHLKEFGFENIYGIDINEQKMLRARNKISDDRIIHSDLSTTPFSDDTFDFIWCSHVLEHSFKPFDCMLEFKRICKKDGYILIILPYPTTYSDVHCGVTDLKLNVYDNADSCINSFIREGHTIERYYRMNVREPELFIKIKNTKI
jgi:ubiquinone/menaquinone biosynthesis C-methylase UbiE